MSAAPQRLYELLPAIHRLRDHAEGQPLAALLEVIEEQVIALEQNLDQLYDDQFIETCADWVAPYIGDLVGYRMLHGVVDTVLSPRAEVANTIRYRRRKGTASMLEQLACDVTGWDVRVVELFQWLAWNQHLKHVRVNPPRGGTVSLRDHDACDRITRAGGSFDQTAHNLDVRSIRRGACRHSVRNVSLFVWRLQAFPLRRVTARRISDGRYTFHPAGLDAPLFNVPQTEDDVAHLAEERNVPGPLIRRVLHDELDARRRAISDAPGPVYFGARPVFEVFLNDEAAPVSPENILICDLSEWHAPPAAVAGHEIRIAVDPQLGRLSTPDDVAVSNVEASYAYGFPAPLGGGPYDRGAVVALRTSVDATWRAHVSKSPPTALLPGESAFETLAKAIDAWNAMPPGTHGVITIFDSASYVEDLIGSSALQIATGSRLALVALNGARPHIQGKVSIKGAAPVGANGGALTLDGLLLEGDVTVLVGNLGALTLSHCTLVPESGRLVVNASGTDDGKRNAGITIAIDHCISGPIELPAAAMTLSIFDSIVSSVDAVAADVQIMRATILGTTSVGTLEARNCIFGGHVAAARRQVGCIGFSYVPVDSTGPRRHHCQPDLEIATQIARAERSMLLSKPAKDQLRASVAARLAPAFTARQYGAPAFGQLGTSASSTLARGADDDGEMGAFHELMQPQREINLRVRMEEYLRFGFEAGIVYVT